MQYLNLILTFVSCPFLGVALSVDTNLDISEKVFESEFNKRYGDQISEKNAAGALAAAEKQVPTVISHYLGKSKYLLGGF